MLCRFERHQATSCGAAAVPSKTMCRQALTTPDGPERHRRFYLAVLSPPTTTFQNLHFEMIRNDNLHVKPYDVKGTQFLSYAGDVLSDQSRRRARMTCGPASPVASPFG